MDHLKTKPVRETKQKQENHTLKCHRIRISSTMNLMKSNGDFQNIGIILEPKVVTFHQEL